MRALPPKTLAASSLLLSALGALAWGCSAGSGASDATDGGSPASEAAAGDDAAVLDGTTGGDGATSKDGAPSSEASGADAGAHDASSPPDAPPGDGGPDVVTIGDAGWILTWSDEFNTGSAPDPASWTFTSLNTTTSGPGWGDEYDDPSAVSVGGGLLTLTATQGSDGGITSGALDTKGKFQQTYGRFEARMKAPPGAGVWPAFWLMGDTNGEGWPTCGEIDIVEVVGSAPKNAYGTVHSGNTTNASQNTSTGGVYTGAADMSADFHVYAVEWSAAELDFYVDENLYETITPSTLTQGQLWAFDHAFYVIFDLAIGGPWAGPANAGTFPAPMQVDYVRVYKKA